MVGPGGWRAGREDGGLMPGLVCRLTAGSLKWAGRATGRMFEAGGVACW